MFTLSGKRMLGAVMIVAAVMIMPVFAETAEQPAADSQAPSVLYRQGIQLYEAQEYEEALKPLQQAAALGHAGAQYHLGMIYQYGYGPEPDAALAFKWYKRAAEQGHAEAQYSLALMYESGEGVAQSDELALQWYRKAAEQDEVSAQVNLGVMYMNGVGTAENHEEGLRWLQRAADKGAAAAQANLATMYINGTGVPEDFAIAREWAVKAAKQASNQGDFMLSGLYDGSETMSDREAAFLDWLKAETNKGDADSLFLLAATYAYGDEVEVDFHKAVPLFQKAAEMGHREAQLNLGLMYQRGWVEIGDMERELLLAKKWLQEAARQGSAEAQYNLGILLQDEGPMADLPEAHYWFSRAAALGWLDAREALRNLETVMTPAQMAQARALLESRSRRVQAGQ